MIGLKTEADLLLLQNFSQDYPEAKLILLYRGKERLLKKQCALYHVMNF